jgi:hypothetical protein
MSQLLVHIRPGCGHRLWCALCLKVHLRSILPLYNQSRTLQGYWDLVLTSRGVFPAQHTLVRSPRDHGRVSLLRRTEQELSDWLRCGGAAWPCSLSQALQADTAVAPTHAPPEKHRLKQGVAVPLPQFREFSQSLALNMSKCQPISPADLPSCTPHLGDPCAPRSSEQVSWITVRTAALKIARPQAPPLSPPCTSQDVGYSHPATR